MVKVCDYMLTGESRGPDRRFYIDSRFSGEDWSTTNAPRLILQGQSHGKGNLERKDSIFHQSLQNNSFYPHAIFFPAAHSSVTSLHL